MFANHCTHQTDATGHCMEATCKNYALYRGEEQRLAVIALRKKQEADAERPAYRVPFPGAQF